MKEEGVIKFNCNWIKGDAPAAPELNSWREQLYARKLIGVTPNGIGYGNMSIRHHKFIITGSQTGHLEKLGPEHYALVTEYDFEENSLTAIGHVKASSESLTHAMIYECCPGVNAVFHVHDEALWKKLLSTSDSTAATIPYGTPEMAWEIQRLLREHDIKIFAMGGHEDGVIAFGETAHMAGELLISMYDHGAAG